MCLVSMRMYVKSINQCIEEPYLFKILHAHVFFNDFVFARCLVCKT